MKRAKKKKMLDYTIDPSSSCTWAPEYNHKNDGSGVSVRVTGTLTNATK